MSLTLSKKEDRRNDEAVECHTEDCARQRTNRSIQVRGYANPFTGIQQINFARAVQASIDTAVQPCEVNYID
jgi:hypothetical protein